MSLFAHRTSTAQGIGARAHQRRLRQATRVRASIVTRQAKARLKMNAVADAFADGCETIPAVAERTGLPKRTVDRLWKQIRDGLGEQAV